MKKSILILIYILLNQVLAAQTEWAAIGTKWYYEDWYRYLIFESKADTTINNRVYKKIVVTACNSDNVTYFLSNYFMRQENKKIYYIENKSDVLLYDFGKNVNDTFKVFIQNRWRFCSKSDSVYVLKVDSVGTDILNGKAFKYQYVHEINGKRNVGYKGKIYEGIGNLKYMFPTLGDTCIVDWGTPFMIKCFYNNNDGLIKFSPYRCDTVLTWIKKTEPDIVQNNWINIFPNPAQNQITIKENITVTNGFTTFEIYNTQGNKIMHGKFNNITILNTENLPSGLYTIRFINKNLTTTKQIIKVK